MATQFTTQSDDLRAPRSDRQSESALTLIRRLMDELALLFRQEVALASSEVTRALLKLGSGLGSLAVGGAVLFAGFLALLAAAILGLALVVDPWLAALLVGAVVVVVGAVTLQIARKALDPSKFKPRHSPESLRRDKDVLLRKST